MVLRGHVESGQIVLDDEASLPDGTEVRIEVLAQSESSTASKPQTLYDRLKAVAGIAKGLPTDFAANHDHYIHGTPKRE